MRFLFQKLKKISLVWKEYVVFSIAGDAYSLYFHLCRQVWISRISWGLGYKDSSSIYRFSNYAINDTVLFRWGINLKNNSLYTIIPHHISHTICVEISFTIVLYKVIFNIIATITSVFVVVSLFLYKDPFDTAFVWNWGGFLYL